MNFRAIVFGDGESAFRYIDEEVGPETKPMPDVAILDLNVPKRDGSEVLAYLRGSPKLRHIPAVVLSSSPKHVIRDRAAQADCYITKPNELEAFLGIGKEIRDCVETVRAARISFSTANRDEGKPETAVENPVQADGHGSNSGTDTPPHSPASQITVRR
jgi:two-component system, chemotaxis family, response regulator Rcp1